MTRHFRKLLLLPAIAAVALVSGCVSYGYRAGHGDYYYGQPTTEYVYPYGYYDYGYPGYYGAPYWSSFGYYGYYGPYRPHQGGHGHGNGNGHGNGHGNGSGNHTPPPEPGSSRPPWRNLDRIGRPDAPARPQRRSDPEFPRAGVEPQARSMPQQVRSMPQRSERMERPARTEGNERPAPWRNAAGNPKRDARPNPAP